MIFLKPIALKEKMTVLQMSILTKTLVICCSGLYYPVVLLRLVLSNKSNANMLVEL